MSPLLFWVLSFDVLNVTFDMHNSSATKKGSGLDNSILFSNAMWSSSRSRTDGTGPFGPVGGARMGTATFDFTGTIPVLDYTAFDQNDFANGIITPLSDRNVLSKDSRQKQKLPHLLGY